MPIEHASYWTKNGIIRWMTELHCDTCGAGAGVGSTCQEAINLALDKGWLFDEDADEQPVLCRACRDNPANPTE